MRKLLVMLAVLWTTGAHADTVPAPTLRDPPPGPQPPALTGPSTARPVWKPTYQSLSIKQDNATAFQWLDGRIASQVDRDVMLRALLPAALEAVRYARTLPGGATQETGTVLSLYVNVVTERVGSAYELRELHPARGSWAVGIQGRDYGQQKTLAKIRDVSITSRNAALCARSPLMTPALLDLLDMRIENGKCVKGAAFAIVPPVEPFDKLLAIAGPIQSGRLMPALTDRQRALLHRTHALHRQASECRCDAAVACPPAGSVADAHRAYEASAGSEEQRHFFTMKPFTGATDIGWSKTDLCVITRGEDVQHGLWMDAQEAGDWYRSQEAANNHAAWHYCQNLKDERLHVRPSCAQVHIDACQRVMTCRELIQLQQPPGSPPL